jgi:hypothetical protein
VWGRLAKKENAFSSEKNPQKTMTLFRTRRERHKSSFVVSDNASVTTSGLMSTKSQTQDVLSQAISAAQGGCGSSVVNEFFHHDQTDRSPSSADSVCLSLVQVPSVSPPPSPPFCKTMVEGRTLFPMESDYEIRVNKMPKPADDDTASEHNPDENERAVEILDRSAEKAAMTTTSASDLEVKEREQQQREEFIKSALMILAGFVSLQAIIHLVVVIVQRIILRIRQTMEYTMVFTTSLLHGIHATGNLIRDFLWTLLFLASFWGWAYLAVNKVWPVMENYWTELEGSNGRKMPRATRTFLDQSIHREPRYPDEEADDTKVGKWNERALD